MEDERIVLPKKAPEEIINLPVCICQINSLGDLIWANKLFINTLIINCEQSIKSIFQLFQNQQLTHNILAKGKPYNIQLYYDINTTKSCFFSVEFTPLVSNNDLLYIVTVQDKSELEREKKTKELLLKLANAEKDSKDLKGLFKSIQQELNTILDARNFFIVLWDKYRQRLTLPYFDDENDEFTTFPHGKTLSGYVIETGKSMLITEMDIFRLQNQGIVEIIGTTAKSWMGVPLKNKEEVIGLIAIQSYKSTKAYTKDHLKILEFVSSQIALSIERKEYVNTLRVSKERAEESDMLKTSFLANMSHEIRTPMNSIVGFSELISRKSTPAEKKDVYAQYISNSSKALLALMDDIIDISKIEAKQLKITKTNVKVNLMLTELFEFYNNFIVTTKQEKITLKKHFAINDSDFCILCDTVRLRQILNNLINNAIKFTNEGFVEFGYIIPNNATILFYIQDTGIGLASEKTNLIFDRFRQGDDSTTRKYGGTGLGLAISKKLVNLMGGQIWVESELEKGTTFYFSLPMIIPSSSEAILQVGFQKTPSQALKGKTILIAEDEDTNYFFLQEILSPTHVSIKRASNGLEAIEIVKNNPDISLVLMDIQMPIMNGYEATQEIKKINPTLPVVAQTAYAMAEDRAKGFRAGCNGYLSKPIKPEDLLNVLKQFLDPK
jgi:signal transduction histidine kinase/CheY-like chemotaxis protein